MLLELQEIYLRICSCRDCGLPEGCLPQLRPPGPQYRRGGIVFAQINPGYSGSQGVEERACKYVRQHNRTVATRKAANTRRLMALQSRYFDNPDDDTYHQMRDAFLRSMLGHWGWPPGKYGATIQDHGVSLEEIAVINLAQCPVPENSYRRRQLERCWTRWTSKLLALLEPRLIVAQGAQVWKFLLDRELPVNAELVEGIHHAGRKSNEEKQKRLLTVRETIRQSVKTEGGSFYR